MLALSLASLPCHAQDQIKVGLDGQAWKELNNSDSSVTRFTKVLLLQGVFEGLSYGMSPLIGGHVIYTNTTFKHLVEALDQFYSDYRNEQVYVVWALQIVSLEIKGTPPNVVEDHLREMRRRSAEDHKKSKN